MHSLAAADFRPLAAPPVLGDGEIHLWFFPHWEKVRDAAASFPVRRLLAAYLGQPIHTLRIQRDDHGKPQLAGACLHFNVSHTASALLVGVSRDIPLGVDLEAVGRRTRAVAELARRWFAPGEAGALATLPEATQQLAFLRLWTAKEAVLKCSGLGISSGLDRVEFELASDGSLLGLRDTASWQVRGLAPDGAHVGALAHRGETALVSAFVTQAIAAGTQSG
jgi:4'-phosphopantetheinyl transferase